MLGEIEVAGPRSLEVCQELLVTNVAQVRLGQAQYSVLCYPEGGIVDDIIGYHIAEDRYLFCVNASNIEKDYDWLTTHNHERADIINRSDEYALTPVVNDARYMLPFAGQGKE